MYQGKILKSGGKELADKLDQELAGPAFREFGRGQRVAGFDIFLDAGWSMSLMETFHQRV